MNVIAVDKSFNSNGIEIIFGASSWIKLFAPQNNDKMSIMKECLQDRSNSDFARVGALHQRAWLSSGIVPNGYEIPILEHWMVGCESTAMILSCCSFLLPLLHLHQAPFHHLFPAPDYLESVPFLFLCKAQHILFLSQHPSYATLPTSKTGRKNLSETTAWNLRNHAAWRTMKNWLFMPTLTMFRLLSEPNKW